MRQRLRAIPTADSPVLRLLTVGGAIAFGAATLRGQPAKSASPAPAPLRVQDVLGVREFAGREQVDLAWDGTAVAFTMVDPRRRAQLAGGATARYFGPTGVPGEARGAGVYVTDLPTTEGTGDTPQRGGTVRLSSGSGSAWGPVWSPDGTRLAFYSDRDGLARVWLWDRRTRALRRVAAAVVRPFFGFEALQWSPDGRALLVKLLPEGLTLQSAARLLPTAAGAPARNSVGAGDRVTATVFATPGAWRTDSANVPGAGVARGAAVDVDRVPSFFNVSLADLALVDVATGTVHRLARRVRPMAYRFSPDGQRIAFTVRQPDAGDGTLVYDRYDVHVVDTRGREDRVLIRRVSQEYGQELSWSPDGRWLAVTDDGAVAVVDAARGLAVRRFARPRMRFAHDYRAPLWYDDETVIVAASDTLWTLSRSSGTVAAAAAAPGRQIRDLVAPAVAQRVGEPLRVVVRDPRTKRIGIARVDLQTGTLTPSEGEAFAFSADLPFALAATADGRRIAFAAEQGDRPAELWTSDADDLTRRRRETELNAAIASHALGQSRLIEWAGPDGRRLQGVLLLPAGYVEGRRYPLVVKVYGGELKSGLVHHFGVERGIDNLQLLATRGFAVLAPDTPLRDGQPLHDLAADVLPAVDSVIAQGVADSARLGLMGHSYGGYSVLALLVQTTRFRAAVVSGGFGNLLGHYGLLRDDGTASAVQWSEHGQGLMGDSPWAVRERYIENSPFFFLDRVRTPVLLLHGGADPTVPVEGAAETFVALRRLGREAVLVRYDGEGHHPGEWGAANAADYWERTFAWFERLRAAGSP